MATKRSFAMPHVNVQQGVGAIVIKHSQLDHVLRLCLKRIIGISVDDQAYGLLTDRVQSKPLRLLIKRAATRSDMLSNEEREKLKRLLKRAEDATDIRNDLIHCLWARKEKGPVERSENQRDPQPVPTMKELRAWAKNIDDIRNDINRLSKPWLKRN